jgi:peroxiredoxin (alkyl hydroperoxide reductase subunit C)
MSAIIGQKAPQFEMDTYYPIESEVKKVTLDNFKGKWLILFFYPADFTFVCPTELKDLSNIYNTLKEMGGEILAVSTDTVYTHKAWLEGEQLLKDVKYPMAADHNGAVSKNYGVYIESSGLSQRGTFIIDPDGVLRTIYTVDEPIGRSSLEVVRLLKALKFVRENPGTACPARWDEGQAVLKPSINIAGHVYEALEK